MNEIQLRQINLNLLVVLDVLLQVQSVTQTAQRLGRTPSAISHALNQLRDLLDDELLVRDGRRMILTVRAKNLAKTLPRMLQQLERTLAGPEAFIPETSNRTFRLAAPDFIAPLIPHLLQDVGMRAPAIKVELTPFSASAIRELAENQYDALIAPSAVQDERLRGQSLGSYPWAVYGRADHPAFETWSLDAWASYPHLQIRTSILHGQGPITRQAIALGIERQVGAIVPSFTMAAPILAQTDLLLTIPTMIMSGVAPIYQLAQRSPPFEIPRMGLSLFRSATLGNEPAVQWFLERVVSAAAVLTERT